MGLKAIMKIQILIGNISFLKHYFKYKATYLFKIDSYVMDKLPPPKCASLWGYEKRGEAGRMCINESKVFSPLNTCTGCSL